jgi:hypothetical protein
LIRTELRVELTGGSETDAGRHKIESLRLGETLRRYAHQAADYDRKSPGPAPEPRYLEVPFGDPDRDGSLPCLEIGRGSDAVKVRGTIDRVDVVAAEEGVAFRVIDYKTGPCPPRADVVDRAVALQLPLYALAAERLLLAEEAGTLRDLGYWGLRDKGYAPIDRVDWPALQDRLEAQVLATVGRLRRGLFVIQPRKDDCTRFCDYGLVCRIAQVRSARKTEHGAGPDVP